VRLPWLAHDEAPGPYITIPQYWFNKTKQNTLSSWHIPVGRIIMFFEASVGPGLSPGPTGLSPVIGSQHAGLSPMIGSQHAQIRAF